MTQLEIYSDFNCTWCYFDKPTIKKIQRNYDVKIRYRAFSLHPDIEDDGMPIAELFGYNFPLMNEKMKKLEEIADSLGLPLAERSTISDTRLAQELAKWAEANGVLEAYHDAVYGAYFSDGLDISDLNILWEVVQQCGLSRAEAVEIIETKAFAQAVDEDWEESEALGIMVAPTYVMNGTQLRGSQPYDKLEELMAINQIPQR